MRYHYGLPSQVPVLFKRISLRYIWLAISTLAPLAAPAPADASPRRHAAIAPIVLPDSSEATLSGYVKDSLTGETIIGATVRVRAAKKGAVTNKSGYFLLRIPGGQDHVVEVNSLGYTSLTGTFRLAVGEERQVTFALSPASIQGAEVTVETDRDKEREAPQVSRVSIQPSQVASLPKAGEADLFRILQLLPGVQTASEISSGLYVRGGSPDQNLILLDGSVLYNPSHFFGFFSTFNSDAIKDVELIKGGFPAEYGGRLSAVLSVTNKDGDREKTKGKVSLGAISSRGTIETPLGDGALTLSGRRTYIDAILSATGLQEELDLPKYNFFDLNGKFTQTLGERDKLAISGYGGKDVLDYSDDKAGSAVLLLWGNMSGSAQWTHLIRNDLFTQFNLTASRYFSDLDLGQGADKFSRLNNINDFSLTGDLEYFQGDEHKMKFGFQTSIYRFQFKVQSGDNPPGADLDMKPFYAALYAQDEWKATEALAFTAGLRADMMTPRSEINVDPRLAARCILSDEVTLKASAGIYHQYLRLASNPNFSFFDVWLPIDSTQMASRAEQYILGIATAPFSGYTFEIEAYYKNMHNLVELRPNIINGTVLSDVFFLGAGRAYGIEFFLQKQVGDLTGWLGYTLAWTRRTFPDINDGEEFAPTFDRRNDVNLVLTYHLSPSWTIGTSFVYGTGQAYTQTTALYPGGSFDEDAAMILIPGKRNALRLEPYHRMDLSATYDFRFFSSKKNASFSIDIYNVYNHRNVWFKQVNSSTNPATVEDVRLLPILPTFSLQVSF